LGGWCLFLLIAASIAVFTLETEYEGTLILVQIGQFIAAIFAIEYVLRIWSATERPRGRLGYILSFNGIIDLLAFAPALLIPAASGSVILRILRLLRLFQLLKIRALRNAMHHVSSALKESRDDLIISFVLSGTLIFLGAVFMYFAEGNIQPEIFGSVPRALWWSVATLTTVGYGDVYPITPLGKLIASCMALIGIAAVAMPAGILAAAFSRIGRKDTTD